jgi:SAM-dependent methyltransferase
VTKAASGQDFFGEPFTWRAEAAAALGVTSDDLPAALSPGPSFPGLLRSIVASLPTSPRTVVDVGSGLGGDSEFLRRATGATVFAVEPSKAARQAAASCFPHLRHVDGDAAHTGLPGDIADVVVMSGVLSLIDEPQPVLTEVARLLIAGGRMAVADLFATGTGDRRSPPNVFRTFDSVAASCSAHGLAVVEVIEAPPSPEPEWAAIADQVDAWIERECHDRDGYDAWRRDREHLDRHIASGDVVGGCVICVHG